MIWASGPDGRRVWFSAGWTRFTGRSPETEVRDGWIESLHPDDRAACLDAFVAAQRTSSRYEATYRLLAADGQYRWVADRGEARFDEGGTFVGYVGSCADISEQRELHDRLTAYLAALQDGFFVVDGTGLVTEANQRLADIVGREIDDLLGTKPPYPWYPTDPGELANVEDANRWLVARGAGEFDLVFRHADGHDVPVIVSAAALSSATGSEIHYVCTVKDVGARRRAEEQRDELLALEHLARRDAEDARQAVSAALARLDALLDHAPVGFAFVDLDLRFVRLNQPMAELVGLPVDAHLGLPVDAVGSEIWEQAQAGFRAAIETGDAIMDTELTAQTAVVPGLERSFLASFYPVRAADGAMQGAGSLLVEITDRKQFERGALLVLQASELFTRARDLDEILDAVVNLPVPGFADSCHVYLDAHLDFERRVAIAHVVPGMSERLLEADARWPLAPDLVLDPRRPDRAALLSVIDDDMRRQFALDAEHAVIVEDHGVVSAIASPLITRGRRLGMLVLNYTKVSGRRYRGGDLQLADELARRFAQALDGARLATRDRRVQAQLDLLAKAGDLLTVEQSADARMQRFVSLVVPDFADLCMVQRRQEDGTFTLAHFAISDPHVVDRFDLVEQWPGIPADPAMASVQAATTGRAVLWPEIPESAITVLGPMGVELSKKLGLRSLLCVPLAGAEREPFGTVAFIQARSGRHFEEADVPLAEELARRAGFAFEHARNYEREQSTAETLQRSLLPARLPRLREVTFAARYRPGGQAPRVGGDWYDVIPRADGRVLLAVGDVVGHGLAAASSTGRLRAALQLSSLDQHDAPEALARMNRYLCSLPDAEMATVAVALLDPATGELRLASAGHPPPLLLSGGQGTFLTGGLGVPLFVLDDAEYEESVVALQPDDVLVVYTDGLVERRGETLDEGLGRLRRVALDGPEDLEALANHLLEALLPEEGPSDDVALLLLRSTRRPAAFEVELPALPDALTGARRALREWLDSVGCNPAEADEVVSAIHEAAANVVEHAYGLNRGHFSISARREDDELVVEVRDQGSWRARAPRPQRGRGFAMMRDLMDSVDVDHGPEGTIVTCRRRIEGRQIEGRQIEEGSG